MVKDTLDAVDDATLNRIVGSLGSLLALHPDDKAAVLVLRNRPILTLRARFGTATPEVRVGDAAERFARVVSKVDFPEVSTRKLEPGYVIYVSDRIIVALTTLDLDPLDSRTIDDVAAEAVANLETVTAEIREERSLKFILRAIALVALATLVLFLLLWLVVALYRFLRRRLEAGEKIVARGVGGETVQEARLVTSASRFLLGMTAWATGILLFFIWLTFVLKRFPYTRPWGEEVYVFVKAATFSLLLGIASTIPDVFTILLIFVIARLLSRLVKASFDAAERGRVSLPGVYPETAMPTRRLLVALVWIFAFVAMYPYLPGSDSEAFKGLGVILGLMISLGGSGVVGQAMSGLVLMYSRALRQGDYVRIGDTEGVVLSLGMLATKIRTTKREEVTIPNSVVLGTSTKNFSRLAGREGVILYTTVTIGYSEPWRKVHEALVEAANRTEGLKKEPKPFVGQTALSDFYVEYQLNAYLDRPENRSAVLQALHANIQDTFNERDITIVSPHYVNDPPHPAPEKDGGVSP